MEETIFRIEWRELAGCWVISRYLPKADAWIMQDTRRFQGGALRYCRNKAGKNAVLVSSVIRPQERMTVVRYQRLTGSN